MKHTKILLFVALSIATIFLLSMEGRAEYWTQNLVIESPEDGESFETGDVVTIEWTTYLYGEEPSWGIDYMVMLETNELTSGEYTHVIDTIPGPSDFIAKHTFTWIVPGNTYHYNPNARLRIYSGSYHCQWDIIKSVIISVKMYYDPIPDPNIQEPLPNIDDDITKNPKANYLSEPYPNPFNPNTTIYFGLKEAASVTMNIYNVQGQLVKALHNNNFMAAGKYRESWNGVNNNGARVPSGIYFLKMNTSSGYSMTKKMVLIQ